jgi:DNA-binding MurR/RpiR family transcriptional regulator
MVDIPREKAVTASLKHLLNTTADRFTPVERRICVALLGDYPFAGLVTIQELSHRANASMPSISRFVNKLGFAGYQEFQQALIGELKEGRRSPIELHLTEERGDAKNYLRDYATRVAARVRQTADSVPQAQFQKLCDLIADPRRSIFMLGGRISDGLAYITHVLLSQVRHAVHHVSSNIELRPNYLLQMRKGDVLLLFDFRRYQADLLEFSRLAAKERRAEVVLITDKWLSPISQHSTHIVPVPIDVGTAWDTLVTAVLILELIVVDISKRDWPSTQARLRAWDALRVTPPGLEPSKLEYAEAGKRE